MISLTNQINHCKEICESAKIDGDETFYALYNSILKSLESLKDYNTDKPGKEGIILSMSIKDYEIYKEFKEFKEFINKNGRSLE